MFPIPLFTLIKLMQQVVHTKTKGNAYLVKKLSFQHHTKEKITKAASKGMVIIKKSKDVLPNNALLTIYKPFVRPHLDYEDILYHQPNN